MKRNGAEQPRETSRCGVGAGAGAGRERNAECVWYCGTRYGTCWIRRKAGWRIVRRTGRRSGVVDLTGGSGTRYGISGSRGISQGWDRSSGSGSSGMSLDVAGQPGQERKASGRCEVPRGLRDVIVRGTPYAPDDRLSSASASDSRLPSAPATSSLFRNAFGRMTSYATRSRPASAPDRMMSRDVA